MLSPTNNGKKYLDDSTFINYDLAPTLCLDVHHTFGTVFEVKQMSTKVKLEWKKYFGMCRGTFEIMARMMINFPTTVIRYV